jgi:bifunctional non-homologous end joining protein LigD
MIASMRPMLATSGTPQGIGGVPVGDDWVHEVKWDGIRLIAEVSTGSASGRSLRLTTRNENDATIAWPELAAGPAPGRDLVVDGEVIALNDAGVPDFRVLGERMHTRDPRKAARFAAARPATYMVFDVLRLDGQDLTGRTWTQRRAILEGLDLGGWQVPATYDDGRLLYEATLAQRLEGIVSKRRDSRYLPGVRSRAWLKFPHRFRASYVVGGWRPQEGTRDRLAALLVGEPTTEGLRYRGRVGSGIGGRESLRLRTALAVATSSPFADQVPREDATGTFWTTPSVVVDIETHGIGYERLRQPTYVGLRADLSPEDLLR